jgi:hypothetical protein
MRRLGSWIFFLEFVCWYHTGYDGLGKFERQRKLGYDSVSFLAIVRDNNTERRVLCEAKAKETVIDVGTTVAVAVA